MPQKSCAAYFPKTLILILNPYLWYSIYDLTKNSIPYL